MRAGTYIHSSVLVEREQQMQLIKSALSSCQDDGGRLLIFEGAPGSGKTALLDSLARHALDNGFQVLAACGSELETEFQYGVVRQLFEGRLLRADSRDSEAVLSGPARLVMTLFGEAGTPGPEPGESMLRALHWLCVNMAVQRPVLLLIDDLHWADAASLRYFAYLAKRLEGHPILVGVAVEPLGYPMLTDIAHALLTQPMVSVIPVNPISEAGVREFAESFLGGQLDDGFVESCYEATGGNPLYLTELLTEFQEAAAVPPDAAIVPQVGPRNVARTAMRRLRQLPGHLGQLTVTAARTLAVLGPTSVLAHFADIAELTPQEAAEAVSCLMDAGIIHSDPPLRFIHPIVAAAVYQDTPRPVRHRAHLRAARALDAAGEPIGRIASHLLAIPHVADDWAAGSLSAAGAEALDRGDPAAAVVLLRGALRLSSRPRADQSALLTRLGLAEVRTRDSEAVRHLGQALDSVTERTARASIVLNLGVALTADGRQADALDLLQETAGQADGLEENVRARLRAEVVRTAQLTQQTHHVAVRELSCREAPVPQDPSVAALLGSLEGFEALIRGDTAGQVVALVERATALGPLINDLDGGAQAAWLVAFCLTCCDRAAEAGRTLDDAIGQADARKLHLVTADLHALRAWVYLRQGLLAEAEAEASLVLGAFDQAPMPSLSTPIAAGSLVDTLLIRDLPHAAARAVDRYGSKAGQPPDLLALPLIAARGRARIADGDLTAGLLDLQYVREGLGEWGTPCPELSPAADISVALTRLGRKEEARELAEEQLSRARAFGSARGIAFALRACALAGRSPVAPALLEEAAELLAGTSAPLDHCVLLADCGTALRRAGRHVDARRRLRAAIEIADSLGAASVARSARDELRTMGIRVRRTVHTGVSSLTPRERCVGIMAAEGKRNQEIAQSLFVTVKTVEWHLSQVYRKLGIASRLELWKALSGA